MAPEPPPSETLFVTGLPIDCTNEYGKEIFSQYGTVKEVTTLPVSAGKNAKAAFVIMETVDDAKWIVEHVNGNVPQNLTSPVTIVFATPRSDRFKGGGFKGMKGKMMAGMMSMMMNPWGGDWGWGGKGKGGNQWDSWGGGNGWNGGWESNGGGKGGGAGMGKAGKGMSLPMKGGGKGMPY